MKLTIKWGELKTLSSGKRLFDGTFIDETGKEFNASVWEVDNKNVPFPGFTELRPSVSFEGNPWTSPTTGKTSIYPPKTGNKTGGNGVKVAQERKAQMIEAAQDRKNESIAFFNATNSAIQLVSLYQAKAEYPLTDAGIEGAIIRWRTFFLNEWKKYESGDYQDKHQAF